MSALSIRFAAAMFVSVALVSVASAGLVSNALLGTDLADTNPYTDGQVLGANVASSSLGFSSGLSGKTGNPLQDDRYVAEGWSTGGFDANDFFEFKITAAAGFVMNFESFVFKGQRGANGPTQFELRSSVTGTSSIGTITSNTNNQEPAITVDLSGAAFQNVADITFQLFGWGADTASGGFSINEYSFNGMTAVPEPTSLILVGMACAPMLLRRRSLVA